MGAPPRSRIFSSEEELAKRDDDHKPSKMASWNVKKKPAWRKRRLFLLLLAGIGVWLFVHYIPTDLGPMDRRTGRRYPPNTFQQPSRAFPPPDPNSPPASPESPPSQPSPDQQPAAPNSPQRADDDEQDHPQRDMDGGPIKFYYLSSTLRAAKHVSDVEPGNNNNVLFAASDLKAAAALIPMACDMARWKRNLVHLAITSRSDISIPDIQQLNGVSQASCNIFWHDARPDFLAISTDKRMETSVAGALGHINFYIHPTAVITAKHEDEDIFFSRGVAAKVKQLGIPHIQVPMSKPQSLAWLARLDASSLKAWHAASIDILVRAPFDSSGSLVRLLKSLAQADYTGFRPPRLTVELPHKMDTATQSFINRYHWPPGPYSTPGQTSELIVRRRIVEQRASVDEASHRFIESFYPTSSVGPHVLLLSPQAELSPVYFHYLKLHLLEYLHSHKAGPVERTLLGISLESPSTFLDAKTPFSPPPASLQQSPEEPSYTPFRWQAPNANAALYFADKWMEIHSFLMRRHSAIRKPSLQSYFQKEMKLVSHNYPSWMEYILQLMRNRGTSMLYPPVRRFAASEPSDSLVTIHNELYQIPEEFSQEDQPVNPDPPPSDDGILTVKDDYLKAHHPTDNQRTLNSESPLLQDLNSMLPPANILDQSNLDQSQEGISQFPSLSGPGQIPQSPPLPRLMTLPVLDYTGKQVSTEQLLDSAKATSIIFRSTAGGCSAEESKSKKALVMSAADLFCFDDDEDEQTKAPGSFHIPASEAKFPVMEEEEDDDDDELLNIAPPPAAIPPPLQELSDPAPPPDPQPPLIQPLQDPNVVQAPPVTDPMRPLEQQNPIAPVPPADPAPQPAPPPPPPQHQPPAPAPAPAPPTPNSNTPQGAPNQPPHPPPSAPDNGPAFPVLDPSKIQAFDEGREAERDAPNAAPP